MIEESSEFRDSLNNSLRFLSYRPRSTAEVYRKLAGNFHSDVVDAVIKWLIDNKYLDDQAFAIQWKNYRERLNPKGEILIRRELRSMGISEHIIEGAVGDIDEEENAYNAVLRFARRRHRIGCDEGQLYRMIYQYLKRRGFNDWTIALVKPRIAAELFP